MTQEELSKLINASLKAISSYENSHNIPNIETLILLSEVFDVSIDDIIESSKEDKAKLSKNMKSKTNKKCNYNRNHNFYIFLHMCQRFCSRWYFS